MNLNFKQIEPLIKSLHDIIIKNQDDNQSLQKLDKDKVKVQSK